MKKEHYIIPLKINGSDNGSNKVEKIGREKTFNLKDKNTFIETWIKILTYKKGVLNE